MSNTRQSGSSTVWSLVLFATLVLFAVDLVRNLRLCPCRAANGHRPEDLLLPRAKRLRDVHRVWRFRRRQCRIPLKRDARWDAVGVAGAEVGTLFCLIVLLTGPLWARKAWGVWWTWDPRLTTTLLAGMIFAAYLALRSMGDAGEVEKRFAAGLALFGLVDLPLIHYSVQRWRGVHPTVITGKGGGLESEMYWALGLSFIAFTGLAVLLIWARASIERQREETAQLRFELMHR